MAHRNKPQLACEVAAGRVVAARASDDGARIEVFTSRRLGPGAVQPSLTHANVQDPAALRDAISGALVTVGGRSRDLIALLPDSSVRMVLLDFEKLPDRATEAVPLLRFRLRKSLPFDVEQAAISYHAWRTNGTVHVAAAVTPQTVIQEYEAAFRDAGYEPGVVLPSLAGALGLVKAAAPTLLVKYDGSAASVALIDQDELRLVRTLDSPSAGELADAAYSALAFYEDTYGARVQRVLVAGVESGELRGALESQTGIRPDELAEAGANESLSGENLPRTLLVSVTGALLA